MSRSSTTLVFVSFLASTRIAAARPGDLDLSFGGGAGYTAIVGGNSAQARGQTVQTDKAIVVTGFVNDDVTGNSRLLTARFRQDGTVDTSFGTNGKRITALSGDVGARGVVQVSDGLVVGGSPGAGGFFLTRYTPFGNDAGPLIDSAGTPLQMGGGSTLWALADQGSGRVLAAGTVPVAGKLAFALGRFALAADAIDATFAGTGLAITEFDAPAIATAMVLLDDGRIVLAGRVCPAGQQCRLGVARYLIDGAPDLTFAGGKVATDTTPFGAPVEFIRVGIVDAGEGKVVVAGGAFDFVRYNDNGTLDDTFGSNGRFNAGLGASSGVRGLLRQRDGKLVGAGWAQVGATRQIAVVRVLADGSGLDPTFGPNGDGKVVTAVSAQASSEAVAIALMPDVGCSSSPEDRAVVAATAFDAAGAASIVVARYLLEDTAPCCGNGKLDAGEVCDVGGRRDTCCADNCRAFKDSGSVCRQPSGDLAVCLQDALCSSDSADCPANPPHDGVDCSDNDACTDSDTCRGGTCQSGELVCSLEVEDLRLPQRVGPQSPKLQPINAQCSGSRNGVCVLKAFGLAQRGTGASPVLAEGKRKIRPGRNVNVKLRLTSAGRRFFKDLRISTDGSIVGAIDTKKKRGLLVTRPIRYIVPKF